MVSLAYDLHPVGIKSLARFSKCLSCRYSEAEKTNGRYTLVILGHITMSLRNISGLQIVGENASTDSSPIHLLTSGFSRCRWAMAAVAGILGQEIFGSAACLV